MGYNNPIEQVLDEGQRMLAAGQTIGYIVSIGTGAQESLEWPPIPPWNLTNIKQIIQTTRGMITDSEMIAERVQKTFRHTKDIYFRFNVDRGMNKIALDEWKQLDAVRAHTREYMQLTNATSQIDQVVKMLLKRKAYQLPPPVSPIAAREDLAAGPVDRTITWQPAVPNDFPRARPVQTPLRTEVPIIRGIRKTFTL
ncbi:hypothetical protein F4777DRAFT_569179 [Nemania sp. FL0916]|nr:hypothetical protein F4777DRAFT_569179 [Nemania sp. FL0916]